jgi:hypothetical protein
MAAFVCEAPASSDQVFFFWEGLEVSAVFAESRAITHSATPHPHPTRTRSLSNSPALLFFSPGPWSVLVPWRRDQGGWSQEGNPQKHATRGRVGGRVGGKGGRGGGCWKKIPFGRSSPPAARVVPAITRVALLLRLVPRLVNAASCARSIVCPVPTTNPRSSSQPTKNVGSQEGNHTQKTQSITLRCCLLPASYNVMSDHHHT